MGRQERVEISQFQNGYSSFCVFIKLDLATLYLTTKLIARYEPTKLIAHLQNT